MQEVCPTPGCGVPIKEGYAYCPHHWFELPKDIRDRIWTEYRRHPGSGQHFAALQAAQEWLEKGAKK